MKQNSLQMNSKHCRGISEKTEGPGVQGKLSTRVEMLVEASLADNTRRTYGSAIRAFKNWCVSHSLEAIPAHPDTVAEYLSDLVKKGRRGSTLKSHACAIAHEHRRMNVVNPIDSYLVRAVLRGSMRLRGSYVDQKLPTAVGHITLLLQQTPNTLTGVRDRAMIALGFAGALRRSELVAVRFEDLEFSSQDLILTIKKSKTDLAGKGVAIGIPNGRHLKVVSLLKQWLDAAEITRGPVFRPVFGSRVISRHMASFSVSRILKAHLVKAGIDPNLYGAHSLRAGFITSAAENGASLEQIMDHSRHADPRNVKVYIRRSNLFREHPGNSFL